MQRHRRTTLIDPSPVYYFPLFQHLVFRHSSSSSGSERISSRFSLSLSLFLFAGVSHPRHSVAHADAETPHRTGVKCSRCLGSVRIDTPAHTRRHGVYIPALCVHCIAKTALFLTLFFLLILLFLSYSTIFTIFTSLSPVSMYRK